MRPFIFVCSTWNILHIIDLLFISIPEYVITKCSKFVIVCYGIGQRFHLKIFMIFLHEATTGNNELLPVVPVYLFFPSYG